jgi:hypothetical protein
VNPTSSRPTAAAATSDFGIKRRKNLSAKLGEAALPFVKKERETRMRELLVTVVEVYNCLDFWIGTFRSFEEALTYCS